MSRHKGKKTGGKKTGGKKNWIERHLSDPYVKQASASGYRSRAAYKLLEIDAQEKLLRPGRVVVDLGAAPGGWSQVAAQRVRSVQPDSPGNSGSAQGATRSGRVIALDLLEMVPIHGVEHVQGDFFDLAVLRQIEALLLDRPVALVMSDMAPNLTGMRMRDQANAEALAEASVEFAYRCLTPGGALLLKVFEGGYVPALRHRLRQHFEKLVMKKPAASRSRSSEQYLLARGFDGIV